MEDVLIKPHHFIDIIKLYGSGIEMFVPDEKMGHDFYKVANKIIANPSIRLRLTLYGDDICKPCKKYQGKCIDGLTHIEGFTSKDEYNITLDAIIISLFDLHNDSYSASQLCSIIFKSKEYIYKVWNEEENEVTEKRFNLFTEGSNKYLKKLSL